MKIIITIIRIAIGWHFLYEGLIKLLANEWSAASYLNSTSGFLSGFYHWLAASSGRLAVIDFLNVWGLILIGLALFIGLFVRWASLAGALLLTLYYFAYPPFGASMYAGGGLAYIINSLFIEAAILAFFFCCKENGYGLENAVQLLKKKKQTSPEPVIVPEKTATNVNTRRELLKDLAALPLLGLAGWGANRSIKVYGADTMSGATIQLNRVSLNELKGEIPKGKLGNHEITRLVMGGNLIAGFAHARDLIYVSQLFKAYNTEKKIFETLLLCEQAGINTMNTSFSTVELMAKFKKVTGSKLKIISQVRLSEQGENILYDNINFAIDHGMDIIQLQGNWGDKLVRDNKLEVINEVMHRVKSNGYVFGLGAHDIHTLLACEENGIIPDYYMKTMHHDNYWSAHPRENRQPFEVMGGRQADHNMYHDNVFCTFPDQTVEFVNRVKVPVMGFKVLAAGAIHPKDGFKWAFENGADFICVGMFDFQVVDNINICIDVLQNIQNRQRAWYA